MNAIKWMLFGIALILTGICVILAISLDAGIAGLLPMAGMLVCILAVSKRD